MGGFCNYAFYKKNVFYKKHFFYKKRSDFTFLKKEFFLIFGKECIF